MKVRLFFLVISMLAIGTATVFPRSITAITEEGIIVTLKSDGTWGEKYDLGIILGSEKLEILPEEQLYSLAMREKHKLLFEQYLNHYEGVDPRRTIEIIYNYISTHQYWNFGIVGKGVYYSYEFGNERAKELFIKGILYTQNNDLHFLVNEYTGLSTLTFYWLMADLLEFEEEYRKALTYVLELKQEFIKHDQKMKYSHNPEQDSLEDLDGKIYLLKLRAGNQS